MPCNNKVADQTVWMHRLVNTFVVSMQQSKFARNEAHIVIALINC